MHRTSNFRMPARRSAAVLGAAVALTAAGTVAVAPAVQAAPAGSKDGAATAAVLRANLDVSLLNKTVDVPLNISLNDVQAPADADETALTVDVGHGVEAGRQVSILRAAAATAKATADDDGAEGYANLVNAQVHVPGLPLLALVKADAVTSTATCRVGERPTASSHLVGVTVLGRRIDLQAVGTTNLQVAGVGQVSLDLTRTVVTSNTAAATALQLKVHINPLSLGVADVSGDITLAQAGCRTPQPSSSTGGSTTAGSTSGSTTTGSTSGTTTGTTTGSTSGTTNGGASNGGATSTGSTSGAATSGTTSGASNGGATNGGSTTGATTGAGTAGGTSSGGQTGGHPGGSTGSQTGSQTGGSTGGAAPGAPSTQTVADTGDLAETGASSSTPYLAAGAAVLVAAGAGTFLLTSRRRKTGAHSADSES